MTLAASLFTIKIDYTKLGSAGFFYVKNNNSLFFEPKSLLARQSYVTADLGNTSPFPLKSAVHYIS